MKNFRLIIAATLIATLCAPPVSAQQGNTSGPLGFPLAPSNLTFYASVSGTGNCLAVGTPCTVATALALVSSYNYQYQYTATVNVADGTYTGTVTLPSLYNYPLGQFAALTGDTTTPTNVVITSASGDALNDEPNARWNITGFRLKSTSGTNSDLFANYGSYLFINKIDFAGSGILINAQNYSVVNWVGGAVTSSTSFAVTGINSVIKSFVVNDSGTWTFSNSPTFSSVFANVGDYGVLGSGTFVNGGTVTATKFLCYNFGLLEASAALPGGTSGTSQFGCLDGTSNGGTLSAPNLGAVGSNTNYNGFTVGNTSSGGHLVNFLSAGSGGQSGLTAGQMGYLDVTSGNMLFWWDISANFTFNGVIGLSASTTGTYSAASRDTGLSRTAAGAMALGNGTAGDASGTLKLSAYQVGGTSPTGTTGSCSGSSFVGGKTAGKFTAALCTAGTYILSGLPTAPNGYVCDAQDQTTPADTVKQTANSAMSVTFTATTAVNDVIVFKCMAF